MGSRQYGVSLEKGETKEVGNQKESVRSGLVLSDSGVMVDGEVTKGYDLLATSFPSAVTWAFLGFQRVSSGDRHSKQKWQCHVCYGKRQGKENVLGVVKGDLQ